MLSTLTHKATTKRSMTAAGLWFVQGTCERQGFSPASVSGLDSRSYKLLPAIQANNTEERAPD